MTLSPSPGFECPTCHGEGRVAIGEHFVTREMARDAGDPSLEGSLYEVEYAPCPNMNCRSGRVADDHRDGLD